MSNYKSLVEITCVVCLVTFTINHYWHLKIQRGENFQSEETLNTTYVFRT